MTGAMRLQAAAVLMASWIGAALLAVGVVAPGAFAVLPSRTMAGAMVGRVLPTLFVAGIVVGLSVAAMVGQLGASGARRGATVAALVAALACATAQFVVTPKLDRLRAEIGGPVDALAAGDARRVAFGVFHGYNVAGLAVAMVGGAVCLSYLFVGMRPRN
jgi:hypothetical protein